MDGRDTSPTGGIDYLRDVSQHIDNQYKSIALDRIRNPVGMQNADTLLNAKEKSGVANKDERRERLLNNFKRALFGTPTE